MSETVVNFGALGMDLEQSLKQLKKGKLTYALNGMIEGFDGQYVNYQNEPGNELCITFPSGYRAVGIYTIYEKNLVVYFLVNTTTGVSQIGTSELDGCVYTPLITASCLNFQIDHPILSVAHRIDNCSTQIFWVDGVNPDRWLDLENLPYEEIPKDNNCDNETTTNIDCNKMSLNPSFSIPLVEVEAVEGDGTLLSGTYQFAVQYANESGQGYTSFYSVTNPVPIFDVDNVTLDFNAAVNKSIKIKVSQLDRTGFYDYINVAVIKTINNINSVELVGFYKITNNFRDIIYTGQSLGVLTLDDIFLKYPIYKVSNDLTTVNDILVRSQLYSNERLSYQEIANNISIKWQTYKVGRKYNYGDEILATNYRGYMRDEVYAFEIVFLLKDGTQTDRFHIPGREPVAYDLTPVLNSDTVDCVYGKCVPPQQPLPRWKVYNTATAGCGGTPDPDPDPDPTTTTTTTLPPVCVTYKIEHNQAGSGSLQFTYRCCQSNLIITETLVPPASVLICARENSLFAGSAIKVTVDGVCSTDIGKCGELPPPPPPPIPPGDDNEGCELEPYDCGDMSYWESEETYPCREDIWGELAGKPIRHHKFPDSVVTHIHDDQGAIYPIGIRISLNEIKVAIGNSSLTAEQKNNIAGFKIVRANRVNHKSVVAKGLIHNVGVYTKDNTSYFFPNYPYNDVRPDPFISSKSTEYTSTDFDNDTESESVCNKYEVVVNSSLSGQDRKVGYQDCFSNPIQITVTEGTPAQVCSLVPPYPAASYDSGDIIVTKLPLDPSVCGGSVAPGQNLTSSDFDGFYSPETKRRFVFHSPDTHFYKPFLGNILKLETAEFGLSNGHFVQTEKHAKYKLPKAFLYNLSLRAAVVITAASVLVGASNRFVDGGIFFSAYSTLVTLLEKTIPRKNYAYHYASYGNYTEHKVVQNTGNKQRFLNTAVYLNPGYINVGEKIPVNNFQRESSVFLKTNSYLPYTHELIGVPRDVSRWLPNCASTDELKGVQTRDISSYYAAIKKCAATQYGQIYSYESVDTGAQIKLSDTRDKIDIFGGDIFINRFAYKSKLPYFTQNMVGVLDETPVFYNELTNVGVTKYWFSLDSTAQGTGSKWSFYGLPSTNLHCQTKPFPAKPWLYKEGRMYLFSYGIPNFYCESEVNVDLRQAFNNKEGDFWPHVGSYIPDTWLQEINVPISIDNTYYYNRTYSKQNKENNFTFLPEDYSKDKCVTVYPFRAVYSEPAGSANDPFMTSNNNWLIYKPSAYFDFPQNFGKLTSLDGIEYRQVLARFENRMQKYNALLTAPTSQADVFLGQPLFSPQTPPVDLAVTDMGYAGTRHKFLLRTEYGIITVDDKRGHVFLISGNGLQNLTSMESGVEQFFNINLQIQLVKSFPNVPIDNTFNGVGIHGVYDAKYNRLILTKLDYTPLVNNIIYKDGVFMIKETEEKIQLTDPKYFCNRSFTISYDFELKSWISFHSYLPSYYVGSSNFFLSGLPTSTWRHLTPPTYCKFYNQQAPYILEYPYAFEFLDEILQAVQDYSKTLQYINGDQVEVDDVYFNKVILYNNQQCSGILNLAPKPKNNLNQYMKYPIYNTDSKTILYTKSDNFYKINQFWSLVKDPKQPIFKKTCLPLSFDKELNQANMNYSKMSFKKAPLRAKDLKCRFILDDRTDTRIVSQLVAVQTQKSFK